MDYDVINSEEMSSFEDLLNGFKPGISNICVGAWTKDNEPVGIVVLDEMDESLSVDYIYVDDAHRNMQVGTELFFTIKKIAAEKKVRLLTGNFAARESYSDELIQFFIAIGAEIRYHRIPYFELPYAEIERALDDKNMDFDAASDTNIKTLRQMPEIVLKSMIEKEEKEGNFLVSRYDYLLADPDRSFYIKEKDEVTYLLISEPRTDASQLALSILWSSNKKSAGLMKFLFGAAEKMKEASIPTESIRMDLINDESYKFATHILPKDKLGFTESIVWWMNI